MSKRKLAIPRPNSVRDPVRIGTSVERDIYEDLQAKAKGDHRSLSDFLRVLLTRYVGNGEGESPAEPEAVEARYSSIEP